MKISSETIVMATAHELFSQVSARTGKRYYATFDEALEQAWCFFNNQCDGSVDIYIMRTKLNSLGNPSRGEYVSFCEKENIIPMEENELATGYDVTCGSFGYKDFDMMVHQARARVSRVEYKEPEKEVLQATKDALEAQDKFWSEVDDRANEWA